MNWAMRVMIFWSVINTLWVVALAILSVELRRKAHAVAMLEKLAAAVSEEEERARQPLVVVPMDGLGTEPAPEELESESYHEPVLKESEGAS